VPHGTPDWGLVGPKETIFGRDDLGEHAVRLGAYHVWDRRGDILLMDDFAEGVNRPLSSVVGAGGYIRLFTGGITGGGFCVIFQTGPVVGDYVLLEYLHGLPRPSRLGIEYSFLHDWLSFQTWRWLIHWYDGVTMWIASVELELATLTLRYYDTGGVYQPFADIGGMIPGFLPWNIGKLVADFGLGRYVRFVYNDVDHDLGAYPIWQFGNATPPHFLVDIRLETGSVGGTAGYVDGVIITHNEP